ncbi:hypothetical protein GGI25_005280 [Coemansia spiralis]|uniref:CAP-Gly domain-containing protein n=2 Tax=Coemansia TaxID=4863 RepID=A0A9W8G2X9_9FUNG|nr:hypothetical protein EDC05_005289 [Coemansia umbellata]KAJ2619744.1 hypothetical protein GGI26_005598 [Coemansia sp. RSA 1358]KAJ2672040.1 hypothetical protein GGI25_005280 [Coemansia spiralis]
MASTDLLGRWFCIDGDCGIVRYVGPVDGTKGEWLGVEWESLKRGKHRGSKDGKQYFHVMANTDSGSFIRKIERIDWGQTLLSAAREQYIVDINELHVPQTIDGKRGKVEVVGLDKIAKQQGDLRSLIVLGLDSQRVFGIGDHVEKEQTKRLLGSSHTLSLAKNYLSKWQDVVDIVETLDKIQTLDVSANHFESPLINSGENGSIRKVDTLRIDSSPSLSWQDICSVAKQLSVRSLSFGWSNLSLLSPIPSLLVQSLDSLEELLLECNQISDFSTLGCLPKLRVLNLSGNQTLIEISSPSGFANLESLNLARTGIDNWKSVDSLALMPRLHTLHLFQTPLFEISTHLNTPQITSEKEEANLDAPRAQVLGRLANIHKLDGTVVTAEERIEMERYYLSLCARQIEKDLDEATLVDVLSQSFPRIQDLVNKHGAPRLPKLQEAKLKSRLAKVSIEVVRGSDVASAEVLQTETKPLICTMLVRQLYPIAIRLARTRSFSLFICVDGFCDQWTCLDTSIRPLSFYGLEDGSIIRILI